MREVLQLCKEREIKTVIASGSEMHMIEKMATDCELSGIVDLLLSGADLPNNKPAPDIYLKAPEKLNLPAEKCLAVEDSAAGIAAAKAAGLRVIAKRNKAVNQDFTQADYVIDDLLDVKEYIAS